MDKIKYHCYGENHPLELSLDYYKNGNLAVTATTWIDGYPEPFGYLTVNVDRRPLNCAFIDTNNNSDDIINWIVSNELGELTGDYGFSGFCMFPEVRFNESILRNIDNEVYNEYVAEFNKHNKAAMC